MTSPGPAVAAEIAPGRDPAVTLFGSLVLMTTSATLQSHGVLVLLLAAEPALAGRIAISGLAGGLSLSALPLARMLGIRTSETCRAAVPGPPMSITGTLAVAASSGTCEPVMPTSTSTMSPHRYMF